MKNKLYIGNIDYAVDDNALASLFSQFGEVVSAQIIVDRRTNRSKGFGFVEMSSEEEAQKAMENLNETEFEGREIIVNIARPKKPRRNYN